MQALYQLKAQLEGLPLEEVAPAQAETALSASDDRLLPLIVAEMEAMQRVEWRDRWHRWSLPSLSQQLRQAVVARAGSLPSLGEEATCALPTTMGAGFAAWAAQRMTARREASVGRLRAFLTAAQDYTATRVEHMRELVQQQAGHSAPGAAAAARS